MIKHFILGVCFLAGLTVFANNKFEATCGDFSVTLTDPLLHGDFMRGIAITPVASLIASGPGIAGPLLVSTVRTGGKLINYEPSPAVEATLEDGIAGLTDHLEDVAKEDRSYINIDESVGNIEGKLTQLPFEFIEVPIDTFFDVFCGSWNMIKIKSFGDATMIPAKAILIPINIAKHLGNAKGQVAVIFNNVLRNAGRALKRGSVLIFEKTKRFFQWIKRKFNPKSKTTIFMKSNPEESYR